MNWDDFGRVDDDAAGAAEQLCPEGVHVATIGWVKMQPKEWAVDPKANRDGMCLTVRLDVKKGIKAIFDSIPCHRRAQIEALCRSARISPPSGDWDESELKGKAVTFESVIKIGKTGRDYVVVKSYKPNAEPLPASIRDRPARTPTQKADSAAGMPEDDIPF